MTHDVRPERRYAVADEDDVLMDFSETKVKVGEWTEKYLPKIALSVSAAIDSVVGNTIKEFKDDPLYADLHETLQNESDDIRHAIRQRVIEILFQKRIVAVDSLKLSTTVLFELHAWIMQYGDEYKRLPYFLARKNLPPGYPADPQSVTDRDERSVLAHALSMQNHDLDHQAVVRRFDAKKFELMNSARYRKLTADPGDMRRIAALYERNAIPLITFEDLNDEKYAKVQKRMERGGMVHLFDPPCEEIQTVKKFLRGEANLRHYKTPKQQLIDHMTGRDGLVGRYETLGMFERDTDRLLAWMSYRLPPKQPVDPQSKNRKAWETYRRDMEKYKRQIMQFFRQKAQMDRDCDMDEMSRHAATTMEIDTINAGVSGTGTPMMHHLLEAVHQEYPDMTHIYLVRYGNMRIVGRKPRDTPNDASGDFFRIRGFVSEGHAFDRNEVAWRETDHGLIFVRPKWIVMRAEFESARNASRLEWEKLCKINDQLSEGKRFGDRLRELFGEMTEEPTEDPLQILLADQEFKDETPSSIGLEPVRPPTAIDAELKRLFCS